MNETKNISVSPETCPAHSYVVKASIAGERNKKAAEVVCALAPLIEQAGGKLPDITYDELIDRCPSLKAAINTAAVADVNKLLKRTFSKAWELLRTQTILVEKYKGIQLPTEIPTILSLDKKLDAQTNEKAGPDSATNPIDGQELALLQTLVGSMLRNRKYTATIKLKEFLDMAGIESVDQKTDVDSALGLLARLGQLYYFPDGLPTKHHLGSFCNILACTCLAEDEDGAEIHLHSTYAEDLLEEDPDVDPELHLPIPVDKITDRIRAA